MESENGNFFMIYSTVNHQRGGWAKKIQKHDDIILEWSLMKKLVLGAQVQMSDHFRSLVVNIA